MNTDEKFFSKIGLNYFILAISIIVIQVIIGNVIKIINPTILNNFNITVIITSLCNYVLPLPIFLFLMKKLEVIQIEKHDLKLRTFIKYIAITLTLMWIGNIIGLTLTAVLGGLMQNDIANPIQDLLNSTDLWLNLILISFIAPIFEELIFRKLLIDRTIKYGARVSIILSALIFGLFHGNLNQFFYAALMGGFFAYVYIKTGKITYTILLHIIVNLMGSVVSFFVAQAIQHLLADTITGPESLILLIYIAIILISLVIGVYSLARNRKSKFNGAKTQINLEHPLKTMILNYGMIFFIGLFIFKIINQIL